MDQNSGEHPFGDKGQVILLVLFLCVWAVDSFVWRISTFMAGYIALYIRIIVLILAIIAAIYLIRSGHAVVKHGKSYSGGVVTGGFRYVRHPLYLGSIIFYLGLAVSTASLFSLGMVVVIFFFYDHIASYEEKLLEDRFNEEYKTYKIRTGKWVPMIGRKS